MAKAKKKRAPKPPADAGQSDAAAPMALEVVPIESLTPDPANARKHSERNIVEIMGSLRRFSQQTPIVVDQQGVIRKGNGTYAAAKRLGWKKIVVIRSRLTGTEAAAYAIADNRVGDAEVGSTWDDEALARTLAALREDGDIGDLVPGFSAEEVAALLDDPIDAGSDGAGQVIDEQFEVIVECANEAEQRRIYERLKGEGLSCRVLNT